MMRSVRLFLGLSVVAAACADSAPAVVENPTETRRQRVLDQTGPNWMVVGGPGLVEMVGGLDGEPDALTGRFALEGSSIVDAASGAGRWVVAGPNSTQPLDDDGLRLSEARDALSGDAIGFIETGPTGWLIGGANGRIQLLDAQGEPSASELQILGNSTVTAASHNGLNWLVGSASGNVVVVNSALTPPNSPGGQVVDNGAPITAIVGDSSTTTPWLAFTNDSVVPISATGVPQTGANVLAGGTITTAAFGDGNVYIGTSDGRIGVASYGPSPTFTFTPAVGGAAVTGLVSNGTDWIAMGANGQAQRFATNGSTMGAAVQISSRSDRPLVGAHWTGTQWLIVVGEIGFVAFVDEQLAAGRTLTPVLGGATVGDASSNGDAVLVVGDGGAVELLDTRGNSVAGPTTTAGGADLYAVGWSGDHWVAAGAGGAVQVINADGSPMGSPTTLLAGQDIRFISWSGEFFLIGGGGGNVQVARTDGTQSSAPFVVAGATDLYAATWSGLDWLVVGTDGTAGAFARMIATDTSAMATIVPETGPLRAVDFNGLEFLVAGDGGLVQRISAQGMTVDAPVDVLTSFGIRDIYFNGVNYIVVGEFGSLRRLGQDYLPLRTPIAVLDREEASAVLWTTPRGFASGPCLTDELCYEGPCVGGLTQGRCCDAACDRACESCFQDDTGEPDGTCAAVVAGKQPPVKVGGASCDRQSEATCGLTGSCDGAGECEFYGPEIECAEAVCSLGRYTDSASCSGTGMCAVVPEQDCSPYAGCTADGCVMSCNANQDCVDGFVCTDNACVEDVIDEQPKTTDEPDDGGCCATTGRRAAGSEAVLLGIALGLLVRRRR